MRTLCLTLMMMTLMHGQEILLEAEQGILTGVTVENALSGYSGTGYVTGIDDAADLILFNFTADTGLYQLSIGYATPYGSKGYDIEVNGQATTGMLNESIGTFAEQDIGTFILKNEQNQIRIHKGWGWYYVDYLRLGPAQINPPLKPEAPLTNPQASQAARSLYRFLLEQYGFKTIAGQQSMEDINYVYQTTGHSPALGVFDLIDYSPSRIEHGASPDGQVENWIAWQQQGDALMSLSWHWNAPTDLLDTPDHEWWRGFYTHATTFNIETVLADTSSQRYHLLLRDIDSIAVQLNKFKEADIPVLWRPLHEAWGGWFWWGAKGAAPFIELWRLLYRRLTEYHQLDNLIWVYTHRDPEWYPGDAFVDIVGLDIYTDSTSNMSGEWQAAMDQFDGKKMVALTESGIPPDPQNIRTFQTRWSWFSVWSGDFIRSANPVRLKELYLDEDIITLDELPDWRSYTAVIYEKPAMPQPAQIKIYPNPANPTSRVQFVLHSGGQTRLSIYNSAGQMVTNRFLDWLTAGSHSYRLPVNGLPSGYYLLEINNGRERLIQGLVLIK